MIWVDFAPKWSWRFVISNPSDGKCENLVVTHKESVNGLPINLIMADWSHENQPTGLQSPPGASWTRHFNLELKHWWRKGRSWALKENWTSFWKIQKRNEVNINYHASHFDEDNILNSFFCLQRVTLRSFIVQNIWKVGLFFGSQKRYESKTMNYKIVEVEYLKVAFVTDDRRAQIYVKYGQCSHCRYIFQ